MVDTQHGADESGLIRVGTEVITLDGESIGMVHAVHPHYLLVARSGAVAGVDVEVPMHAVAGEEDGRLRLSVNLGALNEVRGEAQTAAHRLEE